MTKTLLPGTVLVLFCSILATPATAGSVPPGQARPVSDPQLHPGGAVMPRPLLRPSSLYARRSRRLVQSYLRLKLLEMREADLERARAVVERKLGIGSLLGEARPPYAR